MTTPATPTQPAARYTCTPADPWDERKHGERAFHPKAQEAADYGDARRMACPDCGHSWIEELPQ